MVQSEVVFIRKNSTKIKSYAELLYKQKKANDETAGYVKTALDYEKLEELCRAFIKAKGF